MKTTNYIFVETEQEKKSELLYKLNGYVFHVSNIENLNSIKMDKQINPNIDKRYTTQFGYMNSGFFRNRGCVSLFDYRSEVTEEVQSHRNRLDPFQAARPGVYGKDGIVIFLIKRDLNFYKELILWDKWNEENAWQEQIVPYVEVGYPKPISINLIEEIICVKINEDPFIKILRRKPSSRS